MRCVAQMPLQGACCAAASALFVWATCLHLQGPVRFCACMLLLQHCLCTMHQQHERQVAGMIC
jgi:hypothetical protein